MERKNIVTFLNDISADQVDLKSIDIDLEEEFEYSEDPTKIPRVGFEGILFARVAEDAISRLTATPTGYAIATLGRYAMNDLDALPYKQGYSLLKRKVQLVTRTFHDVIASVVESEMDEEKRERLNEKVKYVYLGLDDIGTVDRIYEEARTFRNNLEGLFTFAIDYYHQALGYQPKPSEIVALVANSYYTTVRIEASTHAVVSAINLEYYYKIDLNNANPRIVINNPAIFKNTERKLRADGEILSPTTQCPFVIGSEYTEAFLDEEREAVEESPLRYTFGALIKDFIGK